MTEPGKSDRWNSLLETLGVPASEPKPAEATAAPQATEKPQSVSLLRPEKPKPAAKPKPAKPAAKSPSYWSRIAGALGLESAAAPVEPPAEPELAPEPPPKVEPQELDWSGPPRRYGRGGTSARNPEPEVQPPALDRPPREERSRESRPQREERSRHAERPARDDRPRRDERPQREEHSRREQRDEPAESGSRSSLGEMFGPKEPDVDVFGLGVAEDTPRVREPSAGRSREVDESGSVLDYEAPTGSGSDLSLGETAGDEGGERDSRRRRRRRRGRGRRGGVEARSESAAAPRHEEDIEPAGEEADFDFERDEELDLGPEEDQPREPTGGRGERERRRGREDESSRHAQGGERPPRDAGDDRGGPRRRRGGRDRGRGPRTAEGRTSGTYGSDEERAEFGPRQPRPAAHHGTRSESDEPDFDLADIEGDDEPGGDVPTHKKIPTWDDAVGILIELNMANRSSGPDRERGRGRGRR